MKRDMELVRRILGYFEGKDDAKPVEDLAIEGYHASTIQYHVILLYEAGLIAGEPTRSKSSDRIIRVLPFRLTWEGHEFLAAAKDDSVWRRVTAKVMAGVSDIPFSLLKEALIATMRSQIA